MILYFKKKLKDLLFIRGNKAFHENKKNIKLFAMIEIGLFVKVLINKLVETYH